MRHRTIQAVLLLAALGFAEEKASSVEIEGAALLDHLKRLASDEWEGRGSGSEGEKKATQYIADHFKALGIGPAGENGTYFQEVKMRAGYDVGKATSFQLVGEGLEPLKVDADFRPFSMSASAKVEGDLVFAGYGISAPLLEYDDYEGLDIAGKIAVVFRNLPHGSRKWRGRGPRQQHAPFTAKLKEAQKRGALALIVVNNPFHTAAAGASATRAKRPDALSRRSIRGPQSGIPFVHMTLAAARPLFAAAFGAVPEVIEKEIHAGPVPAPASRAGRMRAQLSCEVTLKWLTGRNVCGLLEAGAPNAIDELIVVGGHHDHLGYGNAGSLERDPKKRKTIHNGADDNASGTSGVLEIARYLAARRDALRRSVLVMTFTGEERGLLGSRHFVAHPTLPLAKMAAMVNMDMIGRLGGRKLFIGGVKTSPVFQPILDTVVEKHGLKAIFGPGGRAPSDNSSFYSKKMPVLFFFTGLHPDYHRPSDDWDRIDLEEMTKVARAAAETAFALARLEERPGFTRADQGGFGPPRPVLGISVESDPGGVKITGLSPGSAAGKAGLRIGDVITEVDGRKTPGLRALQMAMRRKQVGQKVKVAVLRGDETVEAEVTLGRG